MGLGGVSFWMLAVFLVQPIRWRYPKAVNSMNAANGR